MTDRASETQVRQASDILGSGLFTASERRERLLQIAKMPRFAARDALICLAAEYRCRQSEAQRATDDAA